MNLVGEERLRDFLGRRRTFFFNVAPRYTSGSPAMVPEETALRVAAQEHRSYEHAIAGIYGPVHWDEAGGRVTAYDEPTRPLTAPEQMETQLALALARADE